MNNRYLYLWQAIDNRGSIQEGELITADKSDVCRQLIQQGLQPVIIKVGKRIHDRYWKGDRLIILTRQLATLLQAGLPLVNSLQLLAKENDAPAWRCILQEISQKIAHGQPFSDVVATYPMIFPQLYCQLMAIGELTGELDQCCIQLAQQQERQQQLEKKVTKALRYPVFVCGVAMLVSLLMLTIVLPEFAKIYQSFDAPLPGFTLGLLYLSEVLMRYGFYIAIVLAVMLVGYCKKLRGKPEWQRREQALLLRLPLISPLIRGNCLSQIFQTLAITQKAGLTLVVGLEAATLSINNLFYQQAINQIRRQISQGIPLHHALSKHPLFPALCRQLVCVGEESGSLDTLLDKLASWHRQQTYELADSLAQMLEPILMLVIGGIIGTLIVAMYLPIFQLGNVIG